MAINGLKKEEDVFSDDHLSLHRSFVRHRFKHSDKILLTDRVLTIAKLSKNINSDPVNSQLYTTLESLIAE